MNYGNKFFQIYITVVLLPFVVGFTVLCGVMYGIAALGEELGQVWRLNQ